MNSDGTLTALVNAYQSKQTEYSVSGLGIPGLRHFVYKSRIQVQITQPIFEDPYDQPEARKRSAFFLYLSLCFILLTGQQDRDAVPDLARLDPRQVGTASRLEVAIYPDWR